MKRLFILLILCSHLMATMAPLISLGTLNKEADAVFLAWRVSAPYADISPELKAVLTPEAQRFLVEQAQLPLDRVLTKEELQQKVQNVSHAFRKKYPGSFNVNELDELLKEIIVPEYVFQRDPTAQNQAGKAYNTFYTILSGYRTKPGTWLNIWALRYLTSEAQFVALPIIERETRKGISFNQLETRQRLAILESAAEVVTRQFMSNVEHARKIYGFGLPPFTEEAIKQRVESFLREKFSV